LHVLAKSDWHWMIHASYSLQEFEPEGVKYPPVSLFSTFLRNLYTRPRGAGRSVLILAFAFASADNCNSDPSVSIRYLFAIRSYIVCR
jgi:hypothetical protein